MHRYVAGGCADWQCPPATTIGSGSELLPVATEPPPLRFGGYRLATRRTVGLGRSQLLLVASELAASAAL